VVLACLKTMMDLPVLVFLDGRVMTAHVEVCKLKRQKYTEFNFLEYYYSHEELTSVLLRHTVCKFTTTLTTVFGILFSIVYFFL